MYYGKFVNCGGLIVVLVAILAFIVEFLRMYRISRFVKHDATWLVEDDPNPDKNMIQKWEYAIEADPENEKAV